MRRLEFYGHNLSAKAIQTELTSATDPIHRDSRKGMRFTIPDINPNTRKSIYPAVRMNRSIWS